MQNNKQQTPRHRGFTLTELLVAIALLVVIMLSVSSVFRTTGEAVSAGLAMTSLNRQMAAAEVQLRTDISGFGTDPFAQNNPGMKPVNEPNTTGGPQISTVPLLMIWGQQVNGYLNRNDLDLGATQAFRQDRFAFFANGVFKRQTGGNVALPAQAYSPMDISMEAYIWYGHLWKPDNTPAFPFNTLPGAGTPANNPNNYFANQWTLGRSCILLAEPTTVYTDLGWPNPVNPVLDTTLKSVAWPEGTPVYYYGRNAAPGLNTNLEPLGAPANLAPLAPIVTMGNTGVYGGEPIIGSRYDIAGTLAGMSWANYARLVADRDASPQDDWARGYFSYRFRTKTLDEADWSNPAQIADAMARSVPSFLPGCVNFVVEFAGDYVTQDAGGIVTGGGPFVRAIPGTWNLDGVIDFDLVPVPGTPSSARQIHWYGLARDVDGNGNLDRWDVTPVQWMRGAPMPFEHYVPGYPVLPVGAAMFNMPDYLAAWSPNDLNLGDAVVNTSLAPKLIRITMQVVDAEGKVKDGMTRQYIFPVRFQ